MSNKKHFYAKNIKVGSTVSIYGDDWVHAGPIKIFDGDFEVDRIMLCSLRSPCLYTFVHPTHKFDFYQGTYSDCEELPF